MRIDGNAVHNRSADMQQVARTQAATPGAASDIAAGETAAGDTIELSEEARQIMGAQKESAGSLPVRPEMVERAKALLASKQYNERAVLDKTAERIAQSVNLTA